MSEGIVTEPKPAPGNSAASRAVGSLAGVLAMAIGAIVLLGALPGLILAFTRNFGNVWNGSLAAGNIPLPGPATKDDGGPTGGRVNLSSSEPLVETRTLLAIADTLVALAAVAFGLALVLIAIRLLTGRPMRGLLGWTLGTLGLLLLVAGAVGPQLRARAEDAAILELGLPLIGTEWQPGDPIAFELNLWDPIWALPRTDWTVVGLGVLALLFAAVLVTGSSRTVPPRPRGSTATQPST